MRGLLKIIHTNKISRRYGGTRTIAFEPHRIEKPEQASGVHATPGVQAGETSLQDNSGSWSGRPRISLSTAEQNRQLFNRFGSSASKLVSGEAGVGYAHGNSTCLTRSPRLCAENTG